MKMGTLLAIILGVILGGASYVGVFYWGFETSEGAKRTTETTYVTQETTVINKTETSVQNIQGQETIVTPVTNINLNFGVWSNYIKSTNFISNSYAKTNVNIK